MEYAVLPEGVTKASFERALAEYREIVGEENVLATPEETVSYRRIMVPDEEEAHLPAGALMPASTEEVQRIVAVCNKYKIPVWSISTGRNFGFGTAAAATRGQMILDLRRMNRIVEVDAELGTALVEPGVTYQHLKDYIEERNLPYWIDAPSPGPIVGPVGNSLERGNGYTVYSDHFESCCGMEVVLANGEVLRTGTGGIPNSNSWQAYKYGYGPYLDGIFSQSNFGIVTKMGIWLTPVPEGAKAFAAHFTDEEGIERGIDAYRRLRHKNILLSPGSAYNVLGIVGFLATRAELYDGNGAIPDDVLARIGEEYGVPRWRFGGIVYGDAEQTALSLRKVREEFENAGAAKVFTEPPGDGPAFPAELGAATGQISLGNFSILNYVGGGGVVWYTPVAPLKGRAVGKLCRMQKEILGRYGFDYICFSFLSSHHMHQVTGVYFDRTDARQMKDAKECHDVMVRELAAEGFGAYRTSIHYMDKMADIYGPAMRNFNRRIKRAVDPNGILAPGKSGITI